MDKTEHEAIRRKLAHRLATARRDAGLTQAQAAASFRVCPNTVYRNESYSNGTWPPVHRIIAAAKLYQVSADYLLGTKPTAHHRLVAGRAVDVVHGETIAKRRTQPVRVTSSTFAEIYDAPKT